MGDIEIYGYIPANRLNDPMCNFYDSNTVCITMKDGTEQRTSMNTNLHLQPPGSIQCCSGALL